MRDADRRQESKVDIISSQSRSLDVPEQGEQGRALLERCPFKAWHKDVPRMLARA